MPRSKNETTPSQFRLADDTLALLDRISAHFSLKSKADAIRIAARMTVDSIGAAPEIPKKTPRKKG